MDFFSSVRRTQPHRLRGDTKRDCTSIVVAVKVVLIVIAAIMAFIVGADILLGIKALKVSKNPDASTVDAYLSLSSSTLNICIYLLFINAAKAVRQDVLNCTK